MKSPLKSLRNKTATYIIGAVLALSLTAGMFYDIGRKRTEMTALKRDVERKEQESVSIQLPTVAEENEWTGKQLQLTSMLLADPLVPEFLEEIAGLANENHLERLVINNEDKLIDPKQATADDQKLLQVGVQRYLLLNLKFQSDYPDAARFIAAVSRLSRPVEFQIVDMRRDPPRVVVTMTLKVYKREPA